MINFGKFGDETVYIHLILRQKVLKLILELIILALIILKLFAARGLKLENYTFNAEFVFKKKLY